MLHDLKHAYRMLLQSKGWTVVVLLSLAIGIGATTALFTAVNGLLLQTLSVPEPESRSPTPGTRRCVPPTKRSPMSWPSGKSKASTSS
jgi:hypothetical protein